MSLSVLRFVQNTQSKANNRIILLILNLLVRKGNARLQKNYCGETLWHFPFSDVKHTFNSEQNAKRDISFVAINTYVWGSAQNKSGCEVRVGTCSDVTVKWNCYWHDDYDVILRNYKVSYYSCTPFTALMTEKLKKLYCCVLNVLLWFPVCLLFLSSLFGHAVIYED